MRFLPLNYSLLQATQTTRQSTRQRDTIFMPVEQITNITPCLLKFSSTLSTKKSNTNGAEKEYNIFWIWQHKIDSIIHKLSASVEDIPIKEFSRSVVLVSDTPNINATRKKNSSTWRKSIESDLMNKTETATRRDDKASLAQPAFSSPLDSTIAKSALSMESKMGQRKLFDALLSFP